jgi:hypothetical protein
MHELLAYCVANDWAGYDPYDALNSKVFKLFPFLNHRFPRLFLTQLLKRSPVNLRPFLFVPKTQNPKAMALFLKALIILPRLGLLDRGDLGKNVAEKLTTLRAANIPYWCWGYSFPWQGRRTLVPRGAPNLVCTSFVANAMLDAYQEYQESRFLIMAVSAAEYVVNELYREEDNSVAGFSYPLPTSTPGIHNANFLGAELLCRVYKHCGERRFLEPAMRVARYSASQQLDDGSWSYGQLPAQRWIDNFHTGFNLCALRRIGCAVETSEFEPHLRRGFDFYRQHFFGENGVPKYYHDRLYPIDIHSAAQSIITLVTLKDLDKANIQLAHAVLAWTMSNMWNARGYFYFQKNPCWTVRIPYMRWNQAWMLFALATLEESRQVGLEDSKASTLHV